MAANNEVGTLQPIAEIGEIVRGHPARLHVDAVQFAAHAPIDVERLAGRPRQPLRTQARRAPGRRRAVRPPRDPHAAAAPRRLAGAPATRRNRERRRDRGLGAPSRSPAPRCRPRRIGFASSARNSARAAVGGWREPHRPRDRAAGEQRQCQSRASRAATSWRRLTSRASRSRRAAPAPRGSTEPSHVLLAMGIEPAHGSIRITTGPETTAAEVDRAMEVLHAVLPRLRASREMVASA